MAFEGMVHALELLHSLLKPGGALIDIHPTGNPPAILVRDGNRLFPAGWLQETDGFVEYARAANALQFAVDAGWFELQVRKEFTFLTHADQPDELLEFLKSEWKDAVVTPEVVEHMQALHSAAGETRKILMAERVLISRFLAPNPLAKF
jgi:hypothetical protein